VPPPAPVSAKTSRRWRAACTAGTCPALQQPELPAT
jgi:hypothetical protein